MEELRREWVERVVAEGVTKGHEDFRDNRYIHYLSFADTLWVCILYQPWGHKELDMTE